MKIKPKASVADENVFLDKRNEYSGKLALQTNHQLTKFTKATVKGIYYLPNYY